MGALTLGRVTPGSDTPHDEHLRADGPAGVTSHLVYREWASEALGEERQVYARSTASADGPLVFLPEGQAEQFRDAARSHELVCPVPGCPSPFLTTRGPSNRRHHFVHLNSPGDPDHQRAYIRRVATELLRDWLATAHPKSTVQANAKLGGLEVTLLVTGPTGNLFAVMFVDHRLGVDAWADADRVLERAGTSRAWMFSPRQYLRYPQPKPAAGSDDPAVLDRARGDIVLDRPVFREMRRDGQWPLLLSIERRELANLVKPGGRVARHLRLQPPASGDRVMHLVASPIDDCRLVSDGIATPVVNESVLAVPRLARAKQQQSAMVQARASSSQPDTRPESVKPVRDPNTRRPVTDVVRAAIAASGSTTALGVLIRDLDMFDEAQETDLWEQLNTLRAEGVVSFGSPLGRFDPIHVNRPRSLPRATE